MYLTLFALVFNEIQTLVFNESANDCVWIHKHRLRSQAISVTA